MRRMFVLALSVSCVSASAQALSRIDKPRQSEGFVLRVQADTATEGWRSPRGLSDEFPRHSREDCNRYGAEFGYQECGLIRRKPKPPVEPEQASTVAPSAAPTLRPVKVPGVKPRVAASRTAKPVTRVVTSPSSAALTEGTSPSRDRSNNKDKIGQLIIAGFDGRRGTDRGVLRALDAVRDGQLGGVLFRASNIENYAQLRRLLAQFKKASPDASPFLAIEQPGGPNTTLPETKGFNFYASANLIGRDRNHYSAQVLYREMANELAGLGFNMNLGPSADVCGEDGAALSASCFGLTANQVAAFTTAFNFGHHDAKVLTALRHSLNPRSAAAKVQSEQASTVIIRELAKRQPGDALVITQGGETRPETLVAMPSYSANTSSVGALRLAGFDGAVIFEIKKTGQTGPVRMDETIVKSFEAGADLILIADATPAPAEFAALAAKAVEDALQSGRLTQARIDEAHNRATQLRTRFVSKDAQQVKDEAPRRQTATR